MEYEAFEVAFKSVSDQFEPVDDDPSKMVNQRQAEERASSIKRVRLNREHGRKGGRPRKSATENQPLNQPLNQPPNTVTVTVTDTTNSVPKGTAQGETWNEILAPLCRAVGGVPQTGNWLKYWKPIVYKHGTEEAEQIMWGLRWLIDKSQLEYMGISKGGVCKPSILRSPRADILRRNALQAYHRHAPDQGGELVRKLTAI